jgi:hypothetical protein
MMLRISVFWDVRPYSLIYSRYFSKTWVRMDQTTRHHTLEEKIFIIPAVRTSDLTIMRSMTGTVSRLNTTPNKQQRSYIELPPSVMWILIGWDNGKQYKRTRSWEEADTEMLCVLCDWKMICILVKWMCKSKCILSSRLSRVKHWKGSTKSKVYFRLNTPRYGEHLKVLSFSF